ncbi:4-hydroxyphenylacetate decarboxylase large subunit [Salmonella enterica]|nr:4-hydroxyphenylacetate decarboxylase large subunit [Salmonella enterica]EBW1589815.1 MFS transporter [Salmonella enterica subsp. diarizonae serovar 61:r:z]EDR7604169.1 4-hydroxyphenylacetate decarboxylase large subunit [Salmonella enterica subsp. diarizonae]EAT8025628.1 4-hydroxyphenylacetate decarboxylase large subunit [Salmonella enterica]EBB6121487.1 4-hydroxyphenylacetate decarboxylase large subunit [Salmonella enterica]
MNAEKLAILQQRGIASHAVHSAISDELNLKDAPHHRAKKLRDIYFQTLSSVDTEFPYWYTRKWDELADDVAIIRRAEALKCAFSHLTPNIFPGEKLVMQKTAYYRGSFPMPWLSESFFLANADELTARTDTGSDSAGKLSHFGGGGGNVTQSYGNIVSIAGKFGIRAEQTPALIALARAWEGRSVEALGHKYEMLIPDYQVKEDIMKSVICMFDSGYTIPQGREVVNYYYPLQYGLDGIKNFALEQRDWVAGNADGDGITGMDRLYYYDAVRIIIEGLQNWIHHYEEHARGLAEQTEDAQQRQEYIDIAECLAWIAHHQPRTFREALQLSYTLHLAMLNEDAASGMSPGRLGQILWPWFEQDIAAGRLTEGEALELLQLHRVKLTCVDCFASTGVVGGVLSGNTFNNVVLGGLKKDGQSAANRLEELILEAGIRCQSTQPTLSVLYDEKVPESFLLKAVECTKTGAGYPAWINNQVGMQFLLNQYAAEGMDVEEARAIAIGGCLETSPGSFLPLTLNGKQYDIPGGSGQTAATGVHFLANPKILELVLTNGLDRRTGIQVYPPHNLKLDSFEQLWEQFTRYYAQTCDVVAKANNIQMDIWRKNNMSIMNSFLKPDCLRKGKHIGQMGYRYNATYNIESCGTITGINSLAAIKKLVFDDKTYTLEQLTDALLNNFGYQTAEESGNYSMAEQRKTDTGNCYDDIHAACLNAPKFGNNDAYVDDLLKMYESWFCSMARQYESLYGKKMYGCQISVSTHGPQGACTLASADGRLAGTTYSDGSMSAYPGTDRNGPYALFSSATVWDHSQSQNSQMNLKLHPTSVRGAAGSRKLLELTRSYLRKGGFHIQYNIVDSSTLRDAQQHPENYRELMVRVAGFTQYWCEIGKPIQDEVIARTEYEEM